MKKAFALWVLLAVLAVSARAQRTVSITLDDLPFVGGTLEDAQRGTDALLVALATHGAPADVFATGTLTERDGETAARRMLLGRWQRAGHGLHNHGYSHLRYSATAADAYLADVARGHVLTQALRRDTDTSEAHFYRPPYNDLGDTPGARDSLQAWLRAHSVRLAPFTVEHADYAFDAVYGDALARDDTALARRVREAYLDQLDTAFAFAERLSVATFGREIPQVFLLHANRLNADCLDTMLARLRARGYAFVTLAEATADPAYATPDAYTRRWGISWLHRWRVGLGLPNALRQEPDPPAWLLSTYERR